ncbi:hypothetical protein BACPU_22540 [Bacillus pumilus]|nr:hypothetical protein BACPU_22540 [Bacillus pumilus]
MKKFLIVLICVLLLGACQREDEGKDRRLVAAERMLEAIVEGNKRKMDHIYVDGAVPHPDDIFKMKKDWGMDKLTYEDFQLEEVSIHVFHANYKDTRTGEAKALAFRVKEDPKGGVLIDFVGVVESK